MTYNIDITHTILVEHLISKALYVSLHNRKFRAVIDYSGPHWFIQNIYGRWNWIKVSDLTEDYELYTDVFVSEEGT